MENERDELKFSSPESVVNELLNTEKQMAEETIRLIRQRSAREKEQWNKVFQSKENEVLQLKNQLGLAEEKVKQLQAKLAEEREASIGHIKVQAIEFETQKKQQQKKWGMVEDEIRKYRQEAENARSKFLEIQNQLANFKEEARKSEERLKEMVSNKEEEILSIKEKLLLSEQNYLKDKHRLQETINNLEQKTNRLELSLSDEKLYQEKIIQKKDHELSQTKESLLEKIETITKLEEKRIDEEQKRINAEEKLYHYELEHQKLRQALEEERASWRKRWEEEKASWEKIKEDYSKREESLKVETESHIERIMETLSIIEKQLSEEKSARLSAEQKNVELVAENEKLMERQSEISAQWQKTFSEEVLSLKKRYDEVISEYENNRQTREGEIKQLSGDILNLRASLSETQKLFEVEKNDGIAKFGKIKQLEEEKAKLEKVITEKEKRWEETLLIETSRLSEKSKKEEERYASIIRSRNDELDAIQKQIDLNIGELVKTKQEYQRSSSALVAREMEIKEIKSVLSAKEDEINSLNDRLQRATEEVRNETEERINRLLSEKKISLEQKELAAEELKKTIERMNVSLQERAVAEGELKHRLYSIELERNSELNRHNTEIDSKNKEIERLNADITKIDELYTAVLSDKEKKNSENLELQNKIIYLEEERKRLLLEAVNYQYQRDEQIGLLKKKAEEFQRDRSNIFSMFEEEKQVIRAEYEKRESELGKKISSLIVERESIKQNNEKIVAQLSSEIENHKNALSKEKDERRTVETAIVTAKAKIKELEEKLSDRQRQHEEENARLNESARALASTLEKEKIEFEEKLASAEKRHTQKIEQMSSNIQELKNALSAVRSDLEQSDAELAAKTKIIESVIKENKLISQQLSAGAEVREKEKMELSESNANLKNRVGSLLSELSDSKRAADLEINELKKKLSGLDDIERKREMLLDDWQKERDEWEKTMKSERISFEKRILSEQLKFEEVQSIKNSLIDKLSENVGKLKVDISKYQDAIKEKDGIISDMATSIFEKESLLKGLMTAEQESSSRIKTLKEELNKLREEISLISSEKESLFSSKEAIEKKLRRTEELAEKLKAGLTRQKSEFEDELKKLDATQRRSDAEKNEKSENIRRTLEERVKFLEDKVISTQKELYEGNARFQSKVEETQKLQAKLTAVEVENKKLCDEKSRLNEQTIKMDGKNAILIDGLERKIKSLEKDRAKFLSDIDRVSSEKELLENKLGQAEVKIKEILEMEKIERQKFDNERKYMENLRVDIEEKQKRFLEIKKQECEKFELEIASKYRKVLDELKKESRKDAAEAEILVKKISELKNDAAATVKGAKKSLGIVASRGWIKYLREKILLIGAAVAFVLSLAGVVVLSRMSAIRREIAENYYQNASVMYTRGASEEVAALLEKAIKINPDHKGAKNLYGLILNEMIYKTYRSKDYEQTRLYLDKLSDIGTLDDDLKKIKEKTETPPK